MTEGAPIWITEAEVVELLDLQDAIEALENGLRLQAIGGAQNMEKTHVVWGDGGTLHAIGATFEAANVVGTKTWAHTAGGANPLLVIWRAQTGGLLAIIEAFALGQMRTGAMSGVATRWMSSPGADVMALIGTGKQALSQLASVAAVRRLRSVRIWGRDPGRRSCFVEAARRLGYDFEIETPDTVKETATDASIVALATRATEAFFTGQMATAGAHINAIGAITPEREEFTPDVLARASLVVADDPATTRRLSKEFRDYFAEDDVAWARVLPVSGIVGGAGRPVDADLTIFKAMGMGVSDLALGLEIYSRAVKAGRGRAFKSPERVAPRLCARVQIKELC